MLTSALQASILERLGEDPAAPVFYTAADVLAALNLFQRIYAFLTLCLEEQRRFQLTPGLQTYPMQERFSNLVLIFRCELLNQASTGADSSFDAPQFGAAGFNDQAATVPVADTPKLQPGTFHQFAALDNAWWGHAGTPSRYLAIGFSLLTFNRNPDAAYTAVLTFARMPVALVNADDVPEIPEPDHQALVDGCVAWLRVREGGQELASDAPAMAKFLQAVRDRAGQVRARSIAQRYDHAPPEIEIPDLSRLLRIRKDLTPHRKDASWTSPQ